MTLGPEELAAVTIAICFGAGLNVYATVATLGVLARLHIVALPTSLHAVGDGWIIGTTVVLFVVEFFADKVPAFDLVWNALQTFVRVPVAGLLAYAASSSLSPGWQLAAASGGAAIAFVAHAGKTAARAAVTASPEPVSNSILSLTEDLVAIGLTWFATTHPYIAAGLTIGALAMTFLAIRSVWRMMRRRRQAG
jgi:Domain of unknown function (DUF4126)